MSEPQPSSLAPFAVDGLVNETRLQEVRQVGTELGVLDYKATWNLGRGSDKDRLKFVRTVAAFATTPPGGYVVVGVDGGGRLATNEPPIDPSHFDSATLKSIAESYIDGQFEISSQVHKVFESGASRDLAIIFVEPSADNLPVVIKRDGSYRDNRTQKEIAVVRTGDVWVRDGTRCVRIQHQHWPKILSRSHARARRAGTDDAQELITRFMELVRDEDARGELSGLIDFELPMGPFRESVLAAVDAGKEGPMRRSIRSAGSYIRTQWFDADSAEDVSAKLDRLVAIAAIAGVENRLDLFETAVGNLYDSYKGALESPTSVSPHSSHRAAAVLYWRDLSARLLGLGGLLIREERWSFLPSLVLRPIGDERYNYASWFRHALTEAARANILVNKNGVPFGGAMLSFARSAVEGIPVLFEDVGSTVPMMEPGEAPAGGDIIFNSIAQFDFVWCVISVTRSRSAARNDFYPSFAFGYEYRVAPIVDRLVGAADLRHEALAMDDDGAIAQAMKKVLEGADSEAHLGWGLDSKAMLFIERHS